MVELDILDFQIKWETLNSPIVWFIFQLQVFDYRAFVEWTALTYCLVMTSK